METLSYPWVEAVLARLPAKASALPAAMLLQGQPGLGKRDTALYLSQAILCEAERTRIDPCGVCPACHLIAAGNHPDLRLVEVDSNDEEPAVEGEEEARPAKKTSHQIKVEKIRVLADLVGMTAHRGRAKVIVIGPAEAMHPSAANAVLKMLEEPPQSTYFLLVSHQPDRLIRTVRSRCFIVDFVPPEPGLGVSWLKQKGVAHPEVALALAGYSPLAALNAVRDDAFWERRKALLDLLAGSDFDPLIAADRAEPMAGPEIARMLVQWGYDLIAAGMGLKARYNLDYLDALDRLAGRADRSALFAWHAVVLQYGRVSQHPLNKRLAMEALFAPYPALR